MYIYIRVYNTYTCTYLWCSPPLSFAETSASNLVPPKASGSTLKSECKRP